MSDAPAVTLPKDPDADELTLDGVAEFLRCNSDWELETATFRFTGGETNSGSEWEPADNRLIPDGGNVETVDSRGGQ